MSKTETPTLIRAIAYCRKSTKGEQVDRHGRKKERQEKSIEQQRTEIKKLARDKYEIVAWRDQDKGVSGWKRGLRRPDFNKMLNEVSELKVEAILCDNLDRFSRASYDEVQEDVATLRRAGVRWIVTCSSGTYDLHAGQRNDIGGIITFAAAVWAAREYSRQLGRRVCLARHIRAEEGKRSGGPVPYGMQDDGKGGLKIGDPTKWKRVEWLFEQVEQRRTLNSLCGEWNAKGIKSSRGCKWTVRSLTYLLRNRAYRGDFTYGSNCQGQFYRLDDKGEVVDRDEVKAGMRKPVVVHEGKYKDRIDPDRFDRVQKLLDDIATRSHARKRMYALSGLLRCAHCNSFLTGVKPDGGVVKYRCSGPAVYGKGYCLQRQVREDWLLPRLIAKLEIALRDLVGQVPEHMVEPPKKVDRKRIERDKARLNQRIAVAVERLMEPETSKETRQDINKQIDEMRDKVRRLDAELTAPEPSGFSNEQLDAMADWVQEFQRTAVSLEVSPEENFALAGGLHQDPNVWYSAVLIDPMKVNRMLLDLGIKISVLWRDETPIAKRSGKPRVRHVPASFRIEGGKWSTRHAEQYPPLAVKSTSTTFGPSPMRTGPKDSIPPTLPNTRVIRPRRCSPS
jgi:DNA invertase Pin-like site-specific DNA recombinase